MPETELTADDVWNYIEKSNVCMMADAVNGAVEASPMSPMPSRGEALIWFVISRQSRKNSDLGDDSPVTLLYQDEGNNFYLALRGTISIVDDRDRAEVLWSPVMKEWFSGPNDPDLLLLSFAPLEADVWHGPHKFVASLKLLVTATTGIKTDIGKHDHVEM